MPRFLLALRRVMLAGGLLLTASNAAATENLDAKLGRMAYAALQADEELADLNLGVKALQGGTIILWGPSPSAALTKKAAELLKQVPGVVVVKIECDRDAVVDPLVKKVETDVKGAPPVEPKPEVPPTPPVTVTKVEKPMTDAPKPTTLLLPPTPVADVSSATLERIRKSDARFAKLTLIEEGDRVIITGQSADPADAWALAKKLEPHVGDKMIVVRPRR